jgi:tripartite-type tricarboxylate transporter receptor subunit TctC
MERRAFMKSVAAATAFPSSLAFAGIDQAKLLVGYPAGTATDALARLLGERMRGDYAANFVVENKVGASGQLAVLAAKAAPADGKTILVSPIMVMSVVPHTFSKVGYDPFTDIVPIGNSVTSDFALAVGPAVPDSVTTVQQFIAWCKANPSKASFGTGATGTKIHFSGVKLAQLAGFEFAHVGYTNGGGALTDLAGGNIPAYIGTVPTVMPFLNRIRVLATMGAKRSRFLPSVPTLAEAGFKDMVINEAISLYVPARTAQEQINQLHASMVKALAMPESQMTLNTLGMEATPTGQAEFAAKLKQEHQEWGRFVKQIGFRQDS